MEEYGQSIFGVRCHSQDWPVTQPSGVLGPGHFCPHLQKGSLCPGATQGLASPFSELPEVSDPFFLIPPPRPSPAVGPPSLSCPPVPCHFSHPHKCPTYPALSWCLLPRGSKRHCGRHVSTSWFCLLLLENDSSRESQRQSTVLARGYLAALTPTASAQCIFAERMDLCVKV